MLFHVVVVYGATEKPHTAELFCNSESQDQLVTDLIQNGFLNEEILEVDPVEVESTLPSPEGLIAREKQMIVESFAKMGLDPNDPTIKGAIEARYA